MKQCLSPIPLWFSWLIINFIMWNGYTCSSNKIIINISKRISSHLDLYFLISKLQNKTNAQNLASVGLPFLLQMQISDHAHLNFDQARWGTFQNSKCQVAHAGPTRCLYNYLLSCFYNNIYTLLSFSSIFNI